MPRLTVEDLVRDVPRLAELADLHLVPFLQVPSVELTLADVINLVGRLEADSAHGASGFALTQGTDTLEETAFALDLLWRRDEPVVVTGAMRNPEAPGADGPANLVSCVRVAASAAASGLGCLVVFNEEIHGARFVRKMHTTSLVAFQSPGAGPIGSITEGRVRVWSRPSRLHLLPRPLGERERPVALFRVALGEDGRMLEGLVEKGYAGLVVEAMGGGHVPKRIVQPLADLAMRIPVVLASRTGSGDVLEGTYGFAGSETDLLAHGLTPAGSLDGLKARVLLALLLMADGTNDEISDAFARARQPA
jgi:L-asparaginase